MVQLVRSLLSWLAATGVESTPAGPSVLACSDSGIVVEGSLRVGDIFVRVDTTSSSNTPCLDDCNVLFREILSDEGEGVYKTAPASFSQVFPPETYDAAHKNVAVESILPSCPKHKKGKELQMAHHGVTETQMTRRSLIFGWGSEGEAEEATSLQEQALDIMDVGVTRLSDENERKKDYDDDYYSKSKEDDDDHTASYDKPYKNECAAFFDATKKFVYDVYCVIRQLECTPYHPGTDDHYDDDDDHYDDDDSKSKDKSKDKHARRKLQKLDGRSLQGSTTVNMEAVEDDDDDHKSDSKSKSKSSSDSKSSDHKDDDLYDDDFFDDDYHPDNSGANFWMLLDAACNYVASIWEIFGGDKKDDGKNSYEDDKYYDDYYSKDSSKDKHMRTRRHLDTTDDVDTDYSWWSQLFVSHKPQESNLAEQVPALLEDWLVLEDAAASCPFTKCSGVANAEQCFAQGQHLVGDACRESLEQWDVLSSWNEMDSACQGQDYCYASNVFGQTQCDKQFYSSLMQACGTVTVTTLSSHAPITTGDLSQHCPLVSVLLYSQMQSKSEDVYKAAQESQSMFESTGCRRSS